MSRAFLPKPQVLEFKRGDTITLGCSALDDAGLAVDLTSIVIASELRSEARELICLMEIVPVNLTLGTFELWEPLNALIPVGDHRIDIQYTDNSGSRPLIRSSDTFYVRVLQDETA